MSIEAASAAEESESRYSASQDRGLASDDGDPADEEFNFSWLDPDKKVFVLQNRKYRKKNHLGVFASGAVNVTNPYRSEYLGIARSSFWFSEQIGIELLYAYAANSENANFTALKNVSASALPFVREHRSYYGGLASWTPWYAKLNFFNKILYFDWFFTLGGGMVNTAVDHNTVASQPPNYVMESLPAVFFGTGQNFFVTRSLIVRLDFMGMAYNATEADNVTKRISSNFDFGVGIGYLF